MAFLQSIPIAQLLSDESDLLHRVGGGVNWANITSTYLHNASVAAAKATLLIKPPNADSIILVDKTLEAGHSLMLGAVTLGARYEVYGYADVSDAVHLVMGIEEHTP